MPNSPDEIERLAEKADGLRRLLLAQMRAYRVGSEKRKRFSAAALDAEDIAAAIRERKAR